MPEGGLKSFHVEAFEIAEGGEKGNEGVGGGEKEGADVVLVDAWLEGM